MGVVLWFMSTVDMAPEVSGLHAAVGAVRALMPGDAYAVSVFKVGDELMRSLRFVVTVGAVPPDDAHGMPSRHVHA